MKAREVIRMLETCDDDLEVLQQDGTSINAVETKYDALFLSSGTKLSKSSDATKDAYRQGYQDGVTTVDWP